MNTVLTLVKINRLFSPFIKSRPVLHCIRLNSSATNDSYENMNAEKPKTISYLESKASKEWKSAYNYFVPPDENEVWPSNYRVVVSCLTVIAIYCMLRESNDLDEELEKPIFDQLPHLERPMMESALLNAYNQGLPTEHIVKRLKELEAEGK